MSGKFPEMTNSLRILSKRRTWFVTTVQVGGEQQNIKKKEDNFAGKMRVDWKNWYGKSGKVTESQASKNGNLVISMVLRKKGQSAFSNHVCKVETYVTRR